MLSVHKHNVIDNVIDSYISQFLVLLDLADVEGTTNTRKAIETVGAQLELMKQKVEFLFVAPFQDIDKVAGGHRRYMADKASSTEPLKELSLPLPARLRRDI